MKNFKFKVLDTKRRVEVDAGMFKINSLGELNLLHPVSGVCYYIVDKKFKAVHFTGCYLYNEKKSENELYEGMIVRYFIEEDGIEYEDSTIKFVDGVFMYGNDESIKEMLCSPYNKNYDNKRSEIVGWDYDWVRKNC
jgi:hypothetical protein